MAEASWLVAPRHAPAQTDPVEGRQQYAARNSQITMGPINDHIVSSYFISYTELSRTKSLSDIHGLGFFSRYRAHVLLCFLFLPNGRVCDLLF